MGYYNTQRINTDSIIKSIVKQIATIEPQEVLKKYYCQYLNIYGNEWSLTLNQLLSYSYIVCEELIKTNNKLESFEIIYIFNKYLKNFTPKQAEEYAKSHKFRLF